MRAAVRAGKEQTRKREKVKHDKAMEKAKAGWKAARGTVVEKARKAATEEQKAEHDKLKRFLEAAKKRARAKESAAAESAKRLKRAKTAEAALKERAAEELQAALEEESDEDDEDDEADEDWSGTPARRAAAERSRRDHCGRYKALPGHLRVLIWAQLSRRVPPSAINANISDVIGALAPEEAVPLPGERSINLMRSELTVASEAIAAFRVALSKRIISFGWDESSKFGLGLLSSSTQIETQDGQIVDVVMRGAALTAGGTAEAIAWSVDTKVFSHARRLLKEWRAAHEQRFGAGSWAAAGGPAPGSIGMNRLTENTLLMSDTCNAARKCKRLIAAAAMEALKAKVGEAVWGRYAGERAGGEGQGIHRRVPRTHLRNIIINAMANAATAHLKDAQSCRIYIGLAHPYSAENKNEPRKRGCFSGVCPRCGRAGTSRSASLRPRLPPPGRGHVQR